jgi:hypothetical protein
MSKNSFWMLSGKLGRKLGPSLKFLVTLYAATIVK